MFKNLVFSEDACVLEFPSKVHIMHLFISSEIDIPT